MENMKIQVLVSTLKNNDITKLHKKMKIKSDSIFINQNKKFKKTSMDIDKKKIDIYELESRGIGKSRNFALTNSDCDICIVADDDMIYDKNYVAKIREVYKNNPDADMILFNVTIKEKNKSYDIIPVSKKIRKTNCLKYGAVTFTFKRQAIVENNIFFSLLFGGGAKYGSGEDSLFLWKVLDKGLKVYASSENIATVYNDGSTWFRGYNEKFFFDKGALFKSLSPKYYKILIMQFLIRHKKLYQDTFNMKDIYLIMLSGSKSIALKR